MRSSSAAAEALGVTPAHGRFLHEAQSLTQLEKTYIGHVECTPDPLTAMQAVRRLDDETHQLRADLEAENAALLEVSSPADYRRYLGRMLGYIGPVERSLLDTAGLTPFLDPRRLRKQILIEHDLQALGMKPLEVQSIPQCMWVPWFESPWPALGWAYAIERSTLAFPNMFRHLATVMPGEAAFAASFLKVYGPATGQMWKSFIEGLDLAGSTPRHLDMMVAGAAAACRSFRRWRNMLDGKSLSNPPDHAFDAKLVEGHASPSTSTATEES